MTATPPNRWCCRMVELAAHMLPAEHQQRYALEFIAELYALPRPQQVRHAVRVLSRAWALRAALTDIAPMPTEKNAMKHTIRAWLLCHLGRHDWQRHRNAEVSGKDAMYEQCRRCGRERQQYEVPPPGAVLGG